MSHEIELDSNKYISSKRAAQITGYAQDYIGQLARRGLIDARRIGGLWYISMDSLDSYKNKSDTFKPIPPSKQNIRDDLDKSINFDNTEYISASRASELTGYNQDYIGQLARNGKIISRQIGNRWYVQKDALITHQNEKNALLGELQANSVGILSTMETEKIYDTISEPKNLFTYTPYHGDLLPKVGEMEMSDDTLENFQAQSVPIRIDSSSRSSQEISANNPQKIKIIYENRSVPIHGNSIFQATFPVIALTVVVVLSFGLVSMKENAKYTLLSNQGSFLGSLGTLPMVANAQVGFAAFLDGLENILTKEIVYSRVN